MGPAEVIVHLFGHVVVAKLHLLAGAEEIATAVAYIECDKLLGSQNGAHDG
jgi:hypothetical protein